MGSIIRQLKKNIKDEPPLTKYELDNYKLRIIELNKLITNLTLKIKSGFSNNKDLSCLLKYTKELKKISKILENAKKKL